MKYLLFILLLIFTLLTVSCTDNFDRDSFGATVNDNQIKNTDSNVEQQFDNDNFNIADNSNEEQDACQKNDAVNPSTKNRCTRRIQRRVSSCP